MQVSHPGVIDLARPRFSNSIIDDVQPDYAIGVPGDVNLMARR
jgi:hypothetical protein